MPLSIRCCDPVQASNRAVAFCLAFALSLASGCTPAEPPAAGRSEPAPQAAETAGAEMAESPRALVGLWAEFWAPEGGRAETQRYAFLADGRFAWLGPGGDAVRGPSYSGHYGQQGSALRLAVEQAKDAGEAIAAGASLSLELGDCPPNEEAKALDHNYRCLSIGGRTFWRRGEVDREVEKSFFGSQ
ncbi:MAG: hypothetical protein OEZ06_09225 [Myxococcales bacterium]|nr:hypothetical protein [Myxococcales bacterium]